MGRKGRNSDAAAMLNMLPKFELVPMTMYFMMLAKQRRPSITPVVQNGQVLLQQDDLRGVFRHIHAVHDRNADIRGVQRRSIVDAVTDVPDDVPARLQARG